MSSPSRAERLCWASNDGQKMDTMDKVQGFLLFFGLEIVAIVMLIASTIYSRNLAVVIVMGVIAAGCMAVEGVILWVLAIMDGADPNFMTILIVVSAISILSLGIYFPLAIRRCKAHQQRLVSPPALPART
jgi:hypothetical protein